MRTGALWPEETPLSPEPVTSEFPESERALLQARIAELEARGGPFAAGLGEALGDLARRLEQAGDPLAATAVRERALHLTRVNTGLQSPLQLPLLRDQLRSDRLAGDFAALDGRYEYYWRLFGRGRPPFTPIRLAGTLEYLRWQREALRRGLDDDNSDRLLNLIQVGEDFVDQLRQSATLPEGAFVNAGLSHIANYYLLGSIVQPVQEPFDTRFRQPRRFEQDFDDWNPEREQLENRRRGLLRRGETLFDEMLAAAAGPVERARVLRERGDWSQWWGELGDAADAYRAAWAELAGAGLTATAEQWFAEPRPLPDNGVFFVPGDARAVVRLRVEVNALGRARADIVDSEVADERSAKRLTRFIRSTRFRPAFSGGEPVDAIMEDVSFTLLQY